ncbi:MAG TPA: cytochrome c biogenesis protein CcsA [Desulfobacteria bacterium]|nr:cytochrome c biogenesis protein CcsA [Desulfobacteria bacterium]
MNTVEAIFTWTGLFLYVITFALYLAGVIFKKENWLTPAWRIFLGAFMLETAAIAVRWIAAGHPPVQGSYENALLGGWFVALIFAASSLRIKKVRFVTPFVAGVVVIIIGLGLKNPAQIEMLTPPYRSNWLWIHVSFAWLAFSSFIVAAIIGGMFLWRTREDRDSGFSFFNVALNLEEVDRLILGFIGYGFISQILMIASGAIWASNLWGSYWSWDPVETWSLICWITYGLILHLRLTMGFKGRRMAWLAVGAVVTSIICFWGIGAGTGVHTPLL